MSTLESWYQGDSIIAGAVVVVAAVMVVSSVAILAALALKSQPALRHSLLLTALVCCLLSPFVAVAVVKCRLVLFELPLMSPSIEEAAVEGPEPELAINSRSSPSLVNATATNSSTSQGLGTSIYKPRESRVETTAAPLSGSTGDRPSANDVSRAVAESRPQVSRLRRIATAASLVWAAGTLLVLVGITRGCWRLRRIRASLRPARDERLSNLLDEIGRRMGIRRLPQVGLSANVLTPLAMGWLRPVIVLPEASLPQITREQLHDVLVHETAHILRRDHFVVALQLASQALFWPMASIHWLNRQLVCAREEVCDNFVLDHRSPVSYGETLLRLAELARGRTPLAASTGILHWRGKLERRIDGLINSRRNRRKKAGLLTTASLFTLFAASIALICSTTVVAGQKKAPALVSATLALPSGEKKTPELKQHGMPFDGIMFERIVTGTAQEPAFIDIDTGRWMTPPPDLLAAENRGKPVDQWVFPKPLKQWVQRGGIDLAVQIEGRSLAVVGFDLRSGDSFQANQRPDEAAIAQMIASVPAGSSQWITLNRRLVSDALFRKTPFVTREGGLGTFRFHVSGFRGPNTIDFRYELAREPEIPRLTKQPIFAAYEPPILGQLASFLLVDVSDQKLRLRMPGGSNQIEFGPDQVIVRELSHPELRAAGLHTGTLDIEAPAGRVVVNGRGKSVTLRQVGNRVQIEFDKLIPNRFQADPDKRIAEADQLTLWMPELKIGQEDSLSWKTVKPSAEDLRKKAEVRRKRLEAGEAIYAELAAKHGYDLAPGQAIKRVPPPYPDLRGKYWRVTRPDQFSPLGPGGDGPSALTYQWDAKGLHEGWGTSSWTLVGLCDAIHRIKPQQINGPKKLLETLLPGDWVIRGSMTDEEFVQQFDAILRKDMKLPIHLEFRDVPREVYVARGAWHLTPLADSRVRSGGVQIYGKALNFSPPFAGGGGGDFPEFLKWVGRWIDAPIVSEIENPPKHLSWQLHGPAFSFGRPTTEAATREAHDPAFVLHNVELQTGLHFAKEARPIKMLIVERKPL